MGCEDVMGGDVRSEKIEREMEEMEENMMREWE